MKQDPEWRHKYLDAVERLEAEEAAARKLDNVFRLLAGRLCLAAQGRSPQLDSELRKVSDAIRSQAGPPAIEATLDPLSRAITALDAVGEPAAAAQPKIVVTPSTLSSVVNPPVSIAPPASLADSTSLHAKVAIATALESLALIPELRPALVGLQDKSPAELSSAQIAGVLEDAVGIIGEQRSRIQREKFEVASLLQQVNARLEEIAAHLRGEMDDQKSSRDSTRQLNTLVLGEMNELTTSVRRAVDLEDLRNQVRSRLDSINTHLQEFRTREDIRSNGQSDRTERMRVRIVELERESRTLQESLKEEQRLSMIDALTGIPNRAAYDDRVEQEFKRWLRTGEPVSVLAWDLDRFKDVNDAYGHKAGDKVLRVLGQYLAQHVRGTDFVARYGGEEFVMILAGATVEQARSFADKIRLGIAGMGFHFRNKPVTVTASCGITMFSQSDSPDTAFDRADKALYRAKDAGRNCCVVI